MNTFPAKYKKSSADTNEKPRTSRCPSHLPPWLDTPAINRDHVIEAVKKPLKKSKRADTEFASEEAITLPPIVANHKIVEGEASAKPSPEEKSFQLRFRLSCSPPCSCRSIFFGLRNSFIMFQVMYKRMNVPPSQSTQRMTRFSIRSEIPTMESKA